MQRRRWRARQPQRERRCRLRRALASSSCRKVRDRALTRPGLSHALAPSLSLSRSALRPCQPAAEIGDLKDVESDQIIIDFPDPDNLMSSEVTIKPSTSLPRLRLRPRVIPLDRWLIAPARLLASPRRAVDGYWAGGAFKFTMNMPKSYPHDAPKVHCTTKVRERAPAHPRSHHAPARMTRPRLLTRLRRRCQVYHPNIDLQGKVCLNILREDWKPTLSISAVVLGLQFLFVEPNPGDPLNKNAAQTMKDDEPKFKLNVKNSMRGGRVRSCRFSPRPSASVLPSTSNLTAAVGVRSKGRRRGFRSDAHHQQARVRGVRLLEPTNHHDLLSGRLCG